MPAWVESETVRSRSWRRGGGAAPPRPAKRRVRRPYVDRGAGPACGAGDRHLRESASCGVTPSNRSLDELARSVWPLARAEAAPKAGLLLRLAARMSVLRSAPARLSALGRRVSRAD